jgi:hypothetical protein
MSKHNTPSSQIADILAAIESVAPGVHCKIICQSQCRNTTHPILKSPTYPLQSNPLRQACIVVRMKIICQSQCRNTTHPILKSPTYVLQSNQQLRQACIVVPMEIICQSQCRNTTHPLLKSPTYVLQSNQLCQACIVVRMKIICQSQCRNTTPSPEIDDVRAAIESVAPSVHCRSDGNHLSVTMSKQTHPLLKSPTYKLQSNQLRQAGIVVPMEIVCQSQRRNTPPLKSSTYVLQSNQLRQACIVVRMKIICQSQCRNTTHPVLKSATYVLQSNQLRRACVTGWQIVRENVSKMSF